jgi:3',5'-cyclic AMP phosphodiesterase CpdA
VATLGPASALGEDRNECTRWALLSDTHVATDPENRYRGFYPYRNLQEIAGQIACDPPDGVVVTGDLARLKGQVAAYENLKTLLAPVTAQRPVYLGLGNHDDRDDFFRAFANSGIPAKTVENRHVITEVAGPVRLIVLDSLLYVDTIPGMLGLSQRTWLENYLRVCDDRPTILFLHHTPRIDLLDTGRLFRIIAPMPKVKAVVYGHSHKFRFSEYKGIHLINLPATGYNFSGRQPVGWVEARLTARGGEFTLRALSGNRKSDGCSERLVWRS